MATTPTPPTAPEPAAAPAPPHSPRTCAVGVCSPERTPGLLKPAPKGNHTLVELKGPGVFLGAEVLKTCGDTDETTAVLTIDDRNVFTVPFVSAHAIGLTRANNIGVVLLPTPGPSKSLSIGFPTPLRYDRSIVLSVDVQEDNVSQILGNIWHGAAN